MSQTTASPPSVDPASKSMDDIVALCKRRGFVFRASDIYGGINGFWDYGPLGVELKRNVKNAWWEDMVQKRDDIVGLDSAIIMNPKVWEASGHVVSFNDPLVDCRKCKARFRADKIYTVTATSGEDVLIRTAVHAESDDHAREVATEGANSKTRRRIKQKGDRVQWLVYRADRTPEGEVNLCPLDGLVHA